MPTSNDRPSWIITAQELRKCLGEVVLVDVREPEEFAESSIQGCKLIPLGELHERADRELSKDADIVVYCAHGVRSLQAVLTLRGLGFQKLRSLEGGIAEWGNSQAP